MFASERALDVDHKSEPFEHLAVFGVFCVSSRFASFEQRERRQNDDAKRSTRPTSDDRRRHSKATRRRRHSPPPLAVAAVAVAAHVVAHAPQLPRLLAIVLRFGGAESSLFAAAVASCASIIAKTSNFQAYKRIFVFAILLGDEDDDACRNSQSKF